MDARTGDQIFLQRPNQAYFHLNSFTFCYANSCHRVKDKQRNARHSSRNAQTRAQDPRTSGTKCARACCLLHQALSSTGLTGRP